MKSLFSLVLATYLCLTLATGGNAQERRWIEWTGEAIYMGEGVEFLRGWLYESPGLLPGEMALMAIFVDKRANDPDDQFELMSTLGVAFVTILDVAGTYPGRTIVPPVDFGFCEDTGNGCQNFRPIAERIKGGETHSFNEGLRGPIVSAFAFCFGHIASQGQNSEDEICGQRATQSIRTGALTPLYEFMELSGYPNHANTEVALRLNELEDGELSHVTVTFPLGDFMTTLAGYDN
ncbi:hypothetical protein [uncultured Shimia sp.]|uniref:hypothetical protein n=1 Tax=uncultured Shimia sp. TaxID=573152 RepID=UPI00262CCE95|nr:hypothetical protein [uncultured Shimia sp.]